MFGTGRAVCGLGGMIMTGLRSQLASSAAALACLAAQPALAGSAGTTVAGGTVGGQVAAPIALVAVKPLSFGTFAQPTTAGTMVMAPQGNFTTTGGMTSASGVAQPTTRGAAAFTVSGTPGASYGIYGVASVTISNGSATMTVSQFTTDVGLAIGQLGAGGTSSFDIGGTLTASARQAPGAYTGTFPIIVQYY